MSLLHFVTLVFFCRSFFVCFCFFFNHPSTTAIHPLSLHDALPISLAPTGFPERAIRATTCTLWPVASEGATCTRSEEHTSELQSPMYLVCRLLLEKKKNIERHKAASYIRHGYVACTNK